MQFKHLPERQGMYDPAFEKDACGVGFVADVKGTKTNKTVKQGLEILNRMVHRGAVGADPLTGDGAGILIQMPHEFFKSVAAEAKIDLPAYGAYGTGLVFFPQDAAERKTCKEIFETTVKEKGLTLLGWRKVPVDSTQIGATARESEPVIEQIFIGKSAECKEQIDLERKLYVVRKLVENRVAKKQLTQETFFYVVGLSSRTFGYKGLLMPEQVGAFFKDLQDDRLVSAIALVHSRFSTNTFPTWDLAQPFRFLAHNGEINTLRGNINWMRAKEGQLMSQYFTPGELDEMKPIIRPRGSDTAMLDNVFELLCLSGRSLQHTMMMLVPAAWENDVEMKDELKDFYRFHASFMEPWDGPAALAFTDGTTIAATLDRNGLRPAKVLETKDGLVVVASEHGVLDIAPETIKYSGRIEPGKVLLIDTAKGMIIGDSEVKESLYKSHSYGEWVKKGMTHIDDISEKAAIPAPTADVLKAMKVFGYTREDTKMIVKAMAETGKEPVGSMGNDAPPAVLSKKPQLMYTYFKQLFAQVTNPAIDPIREEIVMSLRSYIGTKRNILAESADHCKMLVVDRPVLVNDELAKIKALEKKGQKSVVISLLFDASDAKAFDAALARLEKEADAAIAAGAAFIILSDRGVDAKHAAIPALVAVGLVHHHLVRNANRSQISIVLESGEPREVHHFAVLFGYGADLINPYLAFEVMGKMIDENEIEGVRLDAAIDNYRHAVEAGVLKVLSKIGISTLQSYRGAQIFEALGVHEEVIDRAFVGTPSRIGGVKFAQVAAETLTRHSEAYPANENLESSVLKSGGFYHWRKDGENHLWNPESIAAVQDASRKNDAARYKDFAKLINDQSAQPTTLRSLFKFKPGNAIPLDQVESKESIFKRFVTGAMSFGSISRGAHETLAVAMNRIHGMSNTGEGGEDPARFSPLPNGDSKRSAIKQVASGRFGVTVNYLTNADEIQIKVSQGAKPGEGGQLPGHKVSVTIAATRYTTPGVTLISPPPHHDIYSIEDLAQLIFDLKNANPKARISVKLVSEVGVGTVAAGVAKGHADMILISGGDGGTGASPISSIKHAGLPWELGLSETHQTLVLNDLRSRVRLQTDGQMRTGRDVAIAAILGAEEYGFCTVALIVMGCVMLRHCHLNNCSVGVATQDPILERKFQGRPEWVINYMTFVAEELREIMAQLGVKTVDEMIGRTDLLEVNTEIVPEKAKNIDFSRVLFKPKVPAHIGVYRTKMQDHGLEKALDWKLVSQAKDALEKGTKVQIKSTIDNVNRSAGTILSHHVASRFGNEGLPEDTIHVKFTGVTGQSFGAFLAHGITFEHEGLANDYVGKGLSGGKIIIYPSHKADFKAEDNFIIGNTTFYGAIKGEAYIRGKAGERFCIRNSGLMGVVEGVGDHGCEYMTGGTIVVLGKTGRNFAAGMSGGAAYVYDEDGQFAKRCNMEMVKIEELESEDISAIRTLLHDHQNYTKSPKAKFVLDSFDAEIKKFRKVMPVEYKRILEQKKLEEKMGLANPA
jgi:glutamate synthase domain-containing protein 2/glutamate synthase domain-containing protein 1/glutamate synthase domain-containing protein 3